MQDAPIRTVFGEITDFLATNPTPEEIVAYRLPDDLQVRAHDLLERNGEGELSTEEQAEMLHFVRVGFAFSKTHSSSRHASFSRNSLGSWLY
jgi:hypothetical protein